MPVPPGLAVPQNPPRTRLRRFGARLPGIASLTIAGRAIATAGTLIPLRYIQCQGPHRPKARYEKTTECALRTTTWRLWGVWKDRECYFCIEQA